VDVAYFKALSRHMRAQTEERHETLQDNHLIGRDLNSGSSEHEEVLTT
jgi:hypothetical protein